MTRKGLFVWLVLSFLWIALARARVEARFAWDYPNLNELVVNENYLTDFAALALGAHRVAADIAYIQFLQYYGDPANAEERHDHDGDSHGHRHTIHLGTEGGGYPRIKEYGERLMRLDPFFNRAVLEIGGVLGFNVKRTNESLAFLKEAIERDPSYHRYKLYTAAVLYKMEGRDQALVGVLEKAIEHPDCPPLLENILANLFKKFGDYEKAAHVYLHTIHTAIRESDRETAKAGLVKLIQDHPYLADRLAPHLQ